MKRSTPSIPSALIKVLLETDPETVTELVRFLDLFRNQPALVRTLLSVGQVSYHPVLKGLLWPCESIVKSHYNHQVIYLSPVSNFTHTAGLTLSLVVVSAQPVQVALHREQCDEVTVLECQQISSQHLFYRIPPSPSESRPYIMVENRPAIKSVSYLLQQTV